MWYHVHFNNNGIIRIVPIIGIVKFIDNSSGDYELTNIDGVITTHYSELIFQLSDKDMINQLIEFDYKNVLKNFLLDIRRKKIERTKNI